jgi:hypothetical protein
MNHKHLLFLLIAGLILTAATASSQEKKRNLLTTKYSKSFLEANLDNGTGWVNYPAYSDRAEWQKLPDAVKSYYIQEGEKNLNQKWQSVPATIYLEFIRSGNRRMQEAYMGEITGPLRAMFNAEMIEGKGRFIDQIINGIWALCECTFWGSTAHLSLQKSGAGLPNAEEPVIDLGTSAMGHSLSWMYFYLHKEFDKVNPFVSRRIEYEINRRILEPYYSRTDFWWMGFGDGSVNNWNPYCNGHVLATIMLMEKDFQKRVSGVYKVMSSLDIFTNGYGDDGGCDEGPSYWGMAGASNFESLLLLKKVTNGKVDIFDNQLIKNMAKYIYYVDISYPWFINFADAGPKTSPNAWLVYKYGESINDPLMMGFGSFLARKQEFGTRAFGGSAFIQMESMFDRTNILNYTPKEPLVADFWLPDLQVMGSRDKAGSAEGFFFAAKGGHNAESHNHNDVGSFILYLDGNPAIIDAGVGEYTAKTFSNQRYDIWTMQSAFHNLPTINGIMQKEGRKFSASGVRYASAPGKVTYSLDIAKAYPEDAKVTSWIRTYSFQRGKGLEIEDKYQLKSFAAPSTCSFIVAVEPKLVSKETIEIALSTGKKLNLSYRDAAFDVKIETIDQMDQRLKSNWGEKLYRILLVSKSRELKGSSVISVVQSK